MRRRSKHHLTHSTRAKTRIVLWTTAVLAALAAVFLLYGAIRFFSGNEPAKNRSLSTTERLKREGGGRRRNESAPEKYGEDPGFPGVESAVIGRSVEGRDIRVYRFNRGPKKILIIAGTHGDEYGVEIANGFIDYLRKNPGEIPDGVEVFVLPKLNPDGWEKVQRGNARKVDLNRNLPVKWSAKVDPNDSSGLAGCTAGPKPASEPETRALMTLLKKRFHRIISLHSRGGIIDYSGDGKELAIAMAKASPDDYEIDTTPYSGNNSGSLGNYASTVYKIPVITIELNSDALEGMLPALILAVKY